MVSHSTVRGSVCFKCGKSFKTQLALKAHEGEHGGRYSKMG